MTVETTNSSTEIESIGSILRPMKSIQRALAKKSMATSTGTRWESSRTEE